MISSGSTISARDISSSLRCPPESDPAKSSRFVWRVKRSSSSSARPVLADSWSRHSDRKRLGKNFSPRWPVAPRRMFSMTVSRESTFVSWNVRTMPSRATL
jgi:hypothetical protein